MDDLVLIIGSAAFLAIKAAVDIPRYINNYPYSFAVPCNEETATGIQHIAVEHCPEASRAIEEALRLYRKTIG